MQFSRTFKVRGNIWKVFELTTEFFSKTSFHVENIIKPELLFLSRGNIFGSLLDFDIQKVRTELKISFSQKEEEVHVQCVYETRYGRLITSIDKAVFENEVGVLKIFLTTVPHE